VPFRDLFRFHTDLRIAYPILPEFAGRNSLEIDTLGAY